MAMMTTPASTSKRATLPTWRTMLSEQRHQRAQRRSQSDDDGIGEPKPRRCTESPNSTCANPPSSTEEERNSKLKQGKAAVCFEEVTDQTQSQRPWEDDKGYQAEHQPGIFPTSSFEVNFIGNMQLPDIRPASNARAIPRDNDGAI